MKTEYWVRLTKPEIEHLLFVIEQNTKEGTYYDRKAWHWNRSERIRSKLNSVVKSSNYKPVRHLLNRCLMAFNEILFNHIADAVVMPEDQIKAIRKLIKDLQP